MPTPSPLAPLSRPLVTLSRARPSARPLALARPLATLSGATHPLGRHDPLTRPLAPDPPRPCPTPPRPPSAWHTAPHARPCPSHPRGDPLGPAMPCPAPSRPCPSRDPLGVVWSGGRDPLGWGRATLSGDPSGDPSGGVGSGRGDPLGVGAWRPPRGHNPRSEACGQRDTPGGTCHITPGQRGCGYPQAVDNLWISRGRTGVR